MQIPIASIKPHPLNESIYGEITEEDVADLIQSIEDVGLLEPIVINSRNQCISGHRRIQACRFSGMESIDLPPWIVPSSVVRTWVIRKGASWPESVIPESRLSVTCARRRF